jgi:D-beta-D-heptose 7-phosphate kinase / D-beta-D-heptose 1-phosphate adenosyltransferase
MFDFEAALKRIPSHAVLCIGDVMLDEYIYGEVTRISPEAPAPVLAVANQELVVGGAGNVARNIAGLGARCILVSVVGDDDAGRAVASKLKSDALIDARLVVDASRPTTRKTRFVSEHHSTHLLRADWEATKPLDGGLERQLLDHALSALPHSSTVVLSDYAKGVLSAAVIRALIDAARKSGKPLIVDPKSRNFSIYRGATLITPNWHELADGVRTLPSGESEIAGTIARLNDELDTQAFLVTRGEAGMLLVPRDGKPVHVSAYPVKVRDVSGAGDTVVAALAVMLAIGSDYEAAMRTANAAAAVVVGKRGTATLSIMELRARLLPHASLAPGEKIVFDWSVLDERLTEWRRLGARIGFTNGCFDILHPGHIKLLAQAHALCDRLIVGLNSDASVRRLKGSGRPMQDMQARAEVLAGLEAVDLVVIFDQDTPLELICRVRPQLLAKGGDYRREQVVGHELVEADGGEVVLIDLVPGFSTSQIVRKSRALQSI